jgi:hypothetical protein
LRIYGSGDTACAYSAKVALTSAAFHTNLMVLAIPEVMRVCVAGQGFAEIHVDLVKQQSAAGLCGRA